MISAGQMQPRVTNGRDAVCIVDARVFGTGAGALARCFVRRVMALPEVASVTLEPAEATATVRYRAPERERRPFLMSLAEAVGGAGAEMDDAQVARWSEGEAVTLQRFGERVSTWEVSSAGRSRLQLRHPGLARHLAFARSVERALRAVPGVSGVNRAHSSGKLLVTFEPQSVNAAHIVRVVETQLLCVGTMPEPPQPKPVNFGVANTSVGLATLGELVLPLATSLSAGLLMVTNLGTLREATQQLRQGKFGIPVWITALLACSIASEQVLAFALTDWSFRYWARRWRKDVAAESRALLEESVPVPSHVRLQAPEAVEVQTPAGRLQSGQYVSAETGEVIPVDGRVVAGVALVHEMPLTGVRAPVRKGIGEEVFAGSRVIHGRLEIEILRAGRETRAAQITRTLLQTTAALQGDPALQQRSVTLVDRTVGPMLTTAGVGLAVGDLFTAGAILHQDWLSGADLTVPLETLRDIRFAVRKGAIVRNANALQRLGESRFIVLDDHPPLRMRLLEISALRSPLPDTDSLLRHAAGAGLYLGDERALALVNACEERGLVVRQPELVALDAETVTVREGKHRISLRSWPTAGSEGSPLTIHIDGVEVASLEFHRKGRLQAANAVRRLRGMGMQVFLASERPEEEAAALARELGADLHSGELYGERKIRFLQGLRRRGVRATFVGGCLAHSGLAREAHVSVSLDGNRMLGEDPGDIVLLGQSLDPLVEVAAVSRNHEGRIVRTCRSAMVPNLLCVVGAFAGILNGITAGILANIAVMSVYRRARGSLRAFEKPRDPRRITV